MKNLLSALCSGVIGIGPIGTGIVLVGGFAAKSQPGHDKVCTALKQFTNDNPLQLKKYIADYIKASDTKATDALRSALVKYDTTKVITKDIAGNITFGGEEIKVGQTVTVSANYEKAKVSIWVHEESKQHPVVQVLQQFTDQHPLQLLYVGDRIWANDEFVSLFLRATLILEDKTKTINWGIANKITFGSEAIEVGHTASVGATYEGETVAIGVHENLSWPGCLVLLVLHQFFFFHPLNLVYIQQDPVKASDPRVTKALRSALVQQQCIWKVITPDIANKITFGDEAIKAGHSVRVSAMYEGETVPIWVHEKKKSPVVQALRQFADQHPLKLDYIKDEIKASDPQATKALRSALVQQDATKTITTKIASKVTFGSEIIKVDNSVRVSATYEGETVPILVREEQDTKKIILNYLKQRFSKGDPLLIFMDTTKTRYADEPAVAGIIRGAILYYAHCPLINETVVNGISFAHEKIQTYTTFPLVIKYEDLKGTIYALNTL